MSAAVDMTKIGTTLTREFRGLLVRVVIKDVAWVYGNERYLVSVDGQPDGNMVWINA